MITNRLRFRLWINKASLGGQCDCLDSIQGPQLCARVTNMVLDRPLADAESCSGFGGGVTVRQEREDLQFSLRQHRASIEPKGLVR